MSLIVLPTNNLKLLRANAIAIRQVLDDLVDLDPPVAVTVGWKGERILRRLTGSSDEGSDLVSVSGFGRSASAKSNAG